MNWPEWWSWDLELSAHLFRRMGDRQFNEVDLRTMFADATGYRENTEPGRWAISSRRGNQSWEIIVEPDIIDRTLVVVTAYPIDD